MESEESRNRNRSLVVFIASLAAFGLLLGTFRFIAWPRPAWQSVLLVLLPIPEYWVLLGLAMALPRSSGPKRCIRSAAVGIGTGAVALLVGILMAWNFGEIIYRWNYREHFILWDDLRLLPSLLNMITRIEWFRTVSGALSVYIASGALLLLTGLALLRLTDAAAGAFQNRKDGRWNRLAGLVLVASGLLQTVLFPGETPTVQLVAGFSGLPAAEPAGSGEPADVRPSPPMPALSPEQESVVREAFLRTEGVSSSAFAGIADGDIHLLVVESYGHTLFTNPVHRENIAPVFSDVARRISSFGWSAASGFLHSPAYGGRSWLADATLLTGRRMVNQRVFDGHIYSGEPHLVGQMNAAGYHTVYAAPGTKLTPDDWKNFYGFDEYIIDGDFGWEGPFISFGEMSDQYFLDFVGRRYADSKQPVFLTALMVSSHVPFVFIPEYIEDWDRLGDGSLYREEGIRRFDNNWLTGSEYPEGYVYSMSYVLDSILGYLERYVDDNALVVIVGDHQPRTPISENTATSGVPIHFLSRDSDILRSLEEMGLNGGFIPDDQAPLIPMERFPVLLNQVLRPAGHLARYLNSDG